MNNINIVYTPWSNLKKTADMDVGQIGFHRQKEASALIVEAFGRRYPGIIIMVWSHGSVIVGLLFWMF